jgi:hypothetical protein
VAYRNLWRERQFYTDAPERLHQAAPEHAITDTPDPYAVTYRAPGELDPPEWLSEYPDAEWIILDPESNAPIDTTPWSHEVGYPSENYPDEVTMAAASSAAHSEDYGSDRLGTFDVGPLNMWDEARVGTEFEGFGPTPINPITNVRGLNSNPANNPPDDSYGPMGYRPGWHRDWWGDAGRKLYYGRRETHDQRWLLPDTATVDPGQLAPRDGKPYTSTFDSLARAITNIWQRPMMRREPPPIEDTVITDGSEDTYAADFSDIWVAG